MTFLGLLIGIGIFGFTPFITSFVFLRNAYRAWRGSKLSSRGSVLARVTLGVLLAVGIPLVTHVSYMHTVRKALTEITSGSDQEYAQGVNTLKWLRYDTDQLAMSFLRCDDAGQKIRLSRAYTDLTGKEVSARLSEIAD